MNVDMTYLVKTMEELIGTPSPVGYYEQLKPVLEKMASALGYEVFYNNRNTAFIRAEGEDKSKTVCISAHADTLGLMVRGIGSDGTLRTRPVGGVNFANLEGENVTVHTRGGKNYTGLMICKHHSVHAYEDARTMERNENNCFVLLDEDVKNPREVRELGIRNGDYIFIEPRFTLTESGYVKSRFLDNKGGVAASFAVMKYLAENNKKPKCNVLFAFPFYEEVGGGGAYVPEEVSEFVAVDISILSEDADGTEKNVTVFAKDGNGPYDYDLTNRLIALAEKAGCDYAVDVLYRYGSDASHAFKSANDVRCAAFGMGTHSSHGVERTHLKGLENTARLLLAYVLGE